MKIIKISLGVVLGLVLLAGFYFIYGLYINPKSPLGSADYKEDQKEIAIRYYRPYKNNRLIFGEAADGALVPYGKYWRLGANLTTKLTTTHDLDFAGRLLPKGTYGLYVYPYAENWVLYIHSKTGGFSASEPDEEGILMKINLLVQQLQNPIEQFTMDFIGSDLRMQWETTKVVIPIQ